MNEGESYHISCSERGFDEGKRAIDPGAHCHANLLCLERSLKLFLNVKLEWRY